MKCYACWYLELLSYPHTSDRLVWVKKLTIAFPIVLSMGGVNRVNHENMGGFWWFTSPIDGLHYIYKLTSMGLWFIHYSNITVYGPFDPSIHRSSSLPCCVALGHTLHGRQRFSAAARHAVGQSPTGKLRFLDLVDAHSVARNSSLKRGNKHLHKPSHTFSYHIYIHACW